MNTLSDVLHYLIQVSAAREESVLTKMHTIVDGAKEAIDGLATVVDDKVTDAENTVSAMAQQPTEQTNGQ